MKPRPLYGRLALLSAVVLPFLSHAADSVRLSRSAPASLGRYQARVVDIPMSRLLDVPWPGGEVASVTLDGSPKRFVKWWELDKSGRSLQVAVDWVDGGQPPAVLTVDTLTGTEQLPDGRWTFGISDAASRGGRSAGIRTYEWKFDASRAGNYSVEITGMAWQERPEAVEVELSGATRSGQLDFTGGRRRFASKSIGQMRIPGPGPQVLRVHLGEANRDRLGTLTAVVLRPAPEGARARPGADGSYELRVADGALAGTSLSVIGWGEAAVVPGWTDAAAGVEWLCEEVTPGHYTVELAFTAADDATGEIAVQAFGRTLSVPLVPTGHGSTPARRAVGEIEVTRPGDQSVSIRNWTAQGGWSVSGLRLVRRVP